MDKYQKLTVLIPVYNEKNTLEKAIENIENTDFEGLEKEIILIDDFSTDGSKEILKKLEEKYKVLYHTKNMGKGAALRTGFANMSGDIVIIQDADLEYTPKDYVPLIKAIMTNEIDVAYGSRFKGNNDSAFMFANWCGNKLLTFLMNVAFRTNLTDMETCYKAFCADVLKGIEIKSNRFDFEPEITAKMLKKGVRLKEFPISYNGRKHHEGKKVSWKDAIHAILTIMKYRFFD